MRRALASVVAAILLVLAFGGASAQPQDGIPQGGIVIRAAASGSHLRLSVEGSHLLVNGQLARTSPIGCRLTSRYRGASCRLPDRGSIVIEMGAANDKIRVLDPLPLPLIAYLGSGSDKLIGNDEDDTCYAEGTRRNRCIGNGGDDTCISGPVNTDCVGGPGDDYCKTSVGSDGCWGGPGDDVCYMGDGQDGCHGEEGSDRLFGGEAADRLYGGPGADFCDGGPGIGREQGCEASPEAPFLAEPPAGAESLLAPPGGLEGRR